MPLPTQSPAERPGTAPARADAAPTAAPTRRDDLDGLRAVAILLVAVYHVWVHRVSGGVDVFLLLSGFFVGGGLLRSFARGRPVRLRTYLPRLARRLLPALVVTLLAVVAVTFLVLPTTRWADVSRETLASLLYVENWHLATSGQVYGAADVTQSPLQHVWSLSVQGQLFVLLPLALLTVWWLGRRLDPGARLRLVRAGVIVAAGASFVYAAVLVRVDQPFAYYDTFARAWEYLAGTILALIVTRTAWSRTRRLVAGWLGVALILATGALVDGGAAFPGPWALVPLAGAALVVLAGAGSAPVGVSRLLAWRPLAHAGGYAYSFYLWHWPVLVLVIAIRERPVGWLAGSAVLVLSAGLAWATKRWVEDPLRRAATAGPTARTVSARVRHARSSHRAVGGAVLVTLVLGVVVGPSAWLGYLDQARRTAAATAERNDLDAYPGAMVVAAPDLFEAAAGVRPVPIPVLASEDLVAATFAGCVSGANDPGVVRCDYGTPGAAQTLVLAGGSHSEQWADALDVLGRTHGFGVVTYLKVGCALSIGDRGTEYFNDSCRAWNTAVLGEIQSLSPDLVFTTATRPAWMLPERPGNEYVPDSYVELWNQLTAAGIGVVALRDNPWFDVSVPECLERRGSTHDDCAVRSVDYLDDTSPTDHLDPIPGVEFVDLTDIFCPDGVCAFVQGNRVVYRDTNHLTKSYVDSLVPVLEERLVPLLAWRSSPDVEDAAGL